MLLSFVVLFCIVVHVVVCCCLCYLYAGVGCWRCLVLIVVRIVLRVVCYGVLVLVGVCCLIIMIVSVRL